MFWSDSNFKYYNHDIFQMYFDKDISEESNKKALRIVKSKLKFR